MEGVFTRASRSGLEPLELARKLQREMGEHRRVGLRGEVLVPNHFVARVSSEDHERFREVEHAMAAEISHMLRAHADEQRWGGMGPMRVELVSDPGVRRGRVTVEPSYREAEGPTGGALFLPDGGQVSLDRERVVIGRLPECEVVLSDTNASRRHAEVRWDGRGYVVHDLGSMNGTLLNGAQVNGQARLAPGDVITVGKTSIEVQLS